MVDGRLMVKQQCESCGYVLNGMVPYKQLGIDKENLNDIDEIKSKIVDKEIADELIEFRLKFYQYKKEKLAIPFKEYYLSKEWAEKRNLVLKRDNNICQACLIASATDVHHLTYLHFKNEFLFELISVCKKCHEEIHKGEPDDLYTKIMNTEFHLRLKF